jgi:hypothetical protein
LQINRHTAKRGTPSGPNDGGTKNRFLPFRLLPHCRELVAKGAPITLGRTFDVP